MNEPWEEDLLRHERFLLRLAARLAGPEVEARDLVQEAYVRALERPPRGGAGALRAWLATVVRRGAGRAARGARRRTAREARAARPESQAAVDARLSAHTELLEHLRDLPEGERQALFLRYSEDLTPQEIAARLAVPLETIRTRLRRGRERLRAQLDQRHGRREAWLALLLPAGRMPSPIAPVAAAPTGTATAAAHTLASGILMGTTVKLVIGAAACAAALFLWTRLDEPSTERVEAIQPVVETPRSSTSPELASVASEPQRAEPEPAQSAIDLAFPSVPAPAPPAAARWPLIVRARGAPAQGAHVRVHAKLDAFGRYDAQPLDGVLDAQNRLELDLGPHLADLLAHAGGARAEELIVALDHPALVPAEASLLLPDPLDPSVAPPQPLEVEVVLVPAAIVVGRLVREDGAALSGETLVQAHALTDAGIQRDSNGYAHPAEDGTFRVRVDGTGPHALLVRAEDLRPGTVRVALARGATHDVGDVVLGRGLTIDGHALDLAGAPAGGANVFAMLVDAEEHVRAAEFMFSLPDVIAWKDGAFELLVSQAQAGPDGSFAVTCLAPQRYELDARPSGIEAPLPLEKPVVTAPATLELRPVAAEVQLVFRFPQGRSRNGQGAWIHEGRRHEFDLSAEGLDQAGGVKRYALPPALALRLAFDFDGLAPSETELMTPGVGQVAEHVIELSEQRSARLLVTLRGAPLENGTPFTALIRTSGKVRDQELSVRSGRLELEDLPAGRLSIELVAGRDRFAPQGHLCSMNLEVDLAPGEERHVDVEVVLGGTLILEAQGPDGARLDAECRVSTAVGVGLDLVFVARIPQGRVAGENHLFPGGPSRAVPELRPGTYRATIRAAGYEEQVVELDVRAGTTTERVVVLRPRE